MAKELDPQPGQTQRLLDGIHDIMLNKGEFKTRWGFLPWVKVSKIRWLVSDWGYRGYLVLEKSSKEEKIAS